MRLDAIGKHLKVKTNHTHPNFNADVRSACLAQITPVVKKILPCSGEEIALGLGNHFRLKFEEVHGPHDVIELEDKYLKNKKEIGFAQLRSELDHPGVDALLFHRMHAKDCDEDEWVAVLNLQHSAAKAYWNRFHELSHRIAEPPQKTLPFRRHKAEAHLPVEALMDGIAADIAFFEPIFNPIVQKFAKTERLTFEIIEAIQICYAPTASLLSTMKAVVKYWPKPAISLTAEMRGRKFDYNLDRALRITVQASSNSAANNQLKFWPNMRVPMYSPMDLAFSTGLLVERPENLGNWSTSTGSRLHPLDVYTSARRIGEKVYSLISM